MFPSFPKVKSILWSDLGVEDSDDLLPIFEHQSEVLSANFGDFFLAEMIESQDQRNRETRSSRVQERRAHFQRERETRERERERETTELP